MADLKKLIRLRVGSKPVCTNQIETSDEIRKTKDEVQINCLHRLLVGLREKIREYDQKIIGALTEEELEGEIME